MLRRDARLPVLAPPDRPRDDGRPRARGLAPGDAWGGLAAMLVALPSAIAFGVTIYAPLGREYAAFGAFAGTAGAAVLGLVAASLGGTKRLITAPCAPAAAVLSAFVLALIHDGVAAPTVVLLLAIVGVLTGVMQIVVGALGLGRLMKYMPYPVVSGYLTAIGAILVSTQLPSFLGVPKNTHFWGALLSPGAWRWQAVVVGLATVAAMTAARRITAAVPAAIMGLFAGGGAYVVLGMFDRTLFTLAGNSLVVGPLGDSGVRALIASVGRWHGLPRLTPHDLAYAMLPALTLTVLLSIDTLKTSIVVDVLSRTRHDSNRELMGQGCANISSSLVGGLPGAGTLGATLVNISGGAVGRASSVVEGSLALLAFLVLGPLVSWVPVPALAGILIVIGARMLDRRSLALVRSRSTLLDFAVVVAVVVTALTVSLITASGVGVALAILLFLREQIGGSVVRRRSLGTEIFSKRMRLPAELEILKQRGDRVAIYELQGSLFFGTTDQVYTALEPEIAQRSYIIVDMRRVQTVDVTAAEMLRQVRAMLDERHGMLIFSHLPRPLPGAAGQVFDDLDGALEWVEDRTIAEATMELLVEHPLALGEIELFAGADAETLGAFEACVEKRSYRAGEQIFDAGDFSDDVFLIRLGAVRISLPLGGGHRHHIATFGRGDFFGEMAFLDHTTRSADATAFSDTEVFVLSRRSFDAFAERHPSAAMALYQGLARVLAIRLRYANAELRALRG